jgi:heterodisulfide reductase subunit A
MKVKAEPLRIGVFVCHCGINIGGVVDVPSVVKYASGLPNVVHAEENLYMCSEEALSRIKEVIKEKKLNRVVVAACTPRTHEPLFRVTCQEAGLNPYLFEFVNIREHCSWVHMHQPEAATAKAKSLVRMGVARAQLLEPQEESEVEVEGQALVIGGGISGMHAALNLANQGFQVYLVEKEAELGGMLRKLYRLLPDGVEASKILKPSVEAVKASEKIEIFTSSKIKSIEGYVGNFNVTVINLETGGETRFKVGTIIVATGAVEREPTQLYGYGEYENVITQLQLEGLLKEGKIPPAKKVVMIQCVGARESTGITYCGRICCVEALKNALILKELNPEVEIYILHRDIRTYGRYEEYYQKAYAAQIHHLRFPEEKPPEVSQLPDKKLRVKVRDDLQGRDYTIDCDLLVLSPPLVQHSEGEEVARMLRVPLGQDRFFLEAHAKLRPIDLATDGIFVCGTAHGPKGIPESIAQAYAAASHAAILMASGVLRTEAITAVVDQDICIGCGVCEIACPYGAAQLSNVDGRWVSSVNEALCKGCGVCASSCPALAITMHHYKNEQVLAQIREAFPKVPEEKFEPRILAFTCNWCSYAGADLAGVSRMQYPPNVRIIKLMCSGRVDPFFVFEAFRSGADGILISGCHPGDCHYISGNRWTEARFEELRRLVKEVGLEPERLRLEWVSASEGEKFAKTISSMVEDLRKLGPSPLREVKRVEANPN